MSKVSVIGAGNVGATCANVLAHMNICNEIVILDVKPGVAEGKAIDMAQSAKICGISTKITGVTKDYTATKNSDVVVVTSGLPRKPGMTREELIGVNAGIVKEVVTEVVKNSPNAVVVMVSNPMDTMTYLTYKLGLVKKNKLIGMGGALDSARFNYYLSQALKTSQSNVAGFVIGAHGDKTMVPLMSNVAYKGGCVEKILNKATREKVIADTMVGGATITGLLGTSAFYAPGACSASVVKAVLLDEKRIIPCSVPQNGEYGEEDICIGTPVVLGKGGVEKIVKLKISAEEEAKFHAGAAAQRATNEILKTLNVF
ncbi:MAG: malate dehydrogenase [Bacteroidales bacterium]|nr:malate dehydrogenase [Bacteroidales bacterium]